MRSAESAAYGIPSLLRVFVPMCNLNSCMLGFSVDWTRSMCKPAEDLLLAACVETPCVVSPTKVFVCISACGLRQTGVVLRAAAVAVPIFGPRILCQRRAPQPP